MSSLPEVSGRRAEQLPITGARRRFDITLANGARPQRDDLIMGMILFLPGFIVMLLLGTYPIGTVLALSLQQHPVFSSEMSWVGLDNFAAVASSALFWKALMNDVVFTTSTVVAQTVLGLWVALLLHQSFPGRNLFRGAVLLSYVVPMAVAAIIWRFMLSDSVGIIAHAIRTWNLPIPNTWFTSTRTAMATIVIVAVWKYFPFMVINFLARLQTIDEQLYEAARVDGANPLQTFWHITLPSLMPVIIIVVMLRTIWTFNNWEVVALLTNGGPLDSTVTLPILVYKSLFSEFSLGRASAAASLMMAFLLVAMVFYLRAYSRSEERLQ